MVAAILAVFTTLCLELVVVVVGGGSGGVRASFQRLTDFWHVV